MWWLYTDSKDYGVIALTGIIIFLIVIGLFFTCNKCNENPSKEQIVNDTIKEQIIQYDTVLKNDSILILKMK
jgi:Na+/melibiose symporter-like transporter